MTEETKKIHADFERMVAHLARVHNTTQDYIWTEMYLKALEHVNVKQ
jgi:hypothetical protein